MHHVEGVNGAFGQRNGSVDTTAALLEGFEDGRLAGQVDAPPGQGYRFGYPGPRIMKDRAEGALFARHGPGRLEEGGAFGLVEIEPVAVLIIELDRLGHLAAIRPNGWR